MTDTNLKIVVHPHYKSHTKLLSLMKDSVVSPKYSLEFNRFNNNNLISFNINPDKHYIYVIVAKCKFGKNKYKSFNSKNLQVQFTKNLDNTFSGEISEEESVQKFLTKNNDLKKFFDFV